MRLPRLVLSMSWFKLLASQISVTQAPSKTCRRLRPDSLVCVGCNTNPQRSKATCPQKRPSLEGNSSGNGLSVIHVTSPYPKLSITICAHACSTCTSPLRHEGTQWHEAS